MNLKRLMLMTPGPLAAAIAQLDPLQRDIIIGLLTGDDLHDDLLLAARHRTTEEEVRRQRPFARARLADALRPTA